MGEIEELNTALRWVYCDAKGDGDERGKAFRRAREKVAREARWLVEYDLTGGMADATMALGADLFRYVGSEHKERRFLNWED